MAITFAYKLEIRQNLTFRRSEKNFASIYPPEGGFGEFRIFKFGLEIGLLEL